MAKAFYIGVNGVARKVKQSYIGDNSVARKVKKGYIGVNGVARQFLSGGTPISSLAVGSTFYLNESGSLVPYLVVHQGKPSSIYDDSCNGTWLLRKDIYTTMVWYNINLHEYWNSTVHSYLNRTFLNLFDEPTRSQIKNVKIPYVPSANLTDSVSSGSNGLSCKVFLLSGYEVGFTQDDRTAFPIDGAKLSYFVRGVNSLRIAKLNGAASTWWLRSGFNGSSSTVWIITAGGSYSSRTCSKTDGIRPALIIPSDTLINTSTNTIIT